MLYDFGTDRGIDGMTVTKQGVIVATAGSKESSGVWFFSPEGKKLAVLRDAGGFEQLLLRGRGQEDAVYHGREESVSGEADGGGKMTSRSNETRMTRIEDRMKRIRRIRSV